MTFDQAVLHILRHEGGYVNDPNDPGGETNFGISKRAYPDLNIAALTIDDAKRIYLRDYWNAASCEKLPPSIRLLVLDAAVNQGVGTAIRMLQKTVGANPDGHVGKYTLDLIALMEPKDLLLAFAKARMSRYRVTKGFDIYGSGWLGRLMDVTIEASTQLGNIA